MFKASTQLAAAKLSLPAAETGKYSARAPNESEVSVQVKRYDDKMNILDDSASGDDTKSEAYGCCTYVVKHTPAWILDPEKVNYPTAGWAY